MSAFAHRVEFTHDELAEKLDLGLLAFFAVEITARVISAVRQRQWDVWLAVDATIVAIASLPLGASLPVIRAARLAHLGRHGMHLRHVTLARGVQLAHVWQRQDATGCSSD
jgi:hypothetical protein